MAFRFSLALSGALVLIAPPALATYSIVGADSATREVGGTGTSCLSGSDVYIIYGAAPGFGAIHAQAQANQNGRDRGVELLMQGMAPSDVISAITAASFDTNARVRQYGVADATGRTAGFTGAGDQSFADDRQGTSGTFSYSVQGNILTSEAVLTQAASAFEAAGCDLPDRLMRALEAGAMNGEGDSRCTPDGIPSDSSFIQVERPDLPKGGYLELHVRSSGNESPIPPLRALFDDWRGTHPCPSTPGGGSGGGGGGGSGGSGTTSGGSTSGGASGSPSGGAPSGGTPSGGITSGGSSAAGSPAAGSSSSSKAASEDQGGCGCRVGSRPKASALVALVALAALVLAGLGRRRRQRKTGV